jgi:hypothetical protein
LDAILIFLGSGCLVCLMPLALYLLYLSHLNGRTPPPLVPGPWDFGAVLLGLSGFLILAGPLFLTLIHSAWRSYAFGGWADLKTVGRAEALAGSAMAVGYLILLGVGATLLIRRRRPMTAIYNVAPDAVEPTLVGVLDELGYPWRRNAGQIEIGLTKLTDPSGPPSQFYPHESATVRVDTFPGHEPRQPALGRGRGRGPAGGGRDARPVAGGGTEERGGRVDVHGRGDRPDRHAALAGRTGLSRHDAPARLSRSGRSNRVRPICHPEPVPSPSGLRFPAGQTTESADPSPARTIAGPGALAPYRRKESP